MNSTATRLRAGLLLALISFVCACGAKGPSVELMGQHFSVEIADTDAAREHGLMDRAQMDKDHGMLFIFDDDAPRAFWMKNTRIPLDMLFFDADRRLVSVKYNAPPCTADPCASYSSGAPARYVLELNGGRARELGVSPGDVLTIQR